MTPGKVIPQTLPRAARRLPGVGGWNCLRTFASSSAAWIAFIGGGRFELTPALLGCGGRPFRWLVLAVICHENRKDSKVATLLRLIWKKVRKSWVLVY